MDQVVHLQWSKEEHLIPTPNNVPKNITLVEKLINAIKSINTMRTRFLCKF